MKYFTKEELEDITKELIENPTRDTLKNLNEKYNGSGESLVLSQGTSNVDKVITAMPEVMPAITVEEPIASLEDATVVEPLSKVEENPVINSIPNFNVPNMESPKIESNPMGNIITQETEKFALPKLETPPVVNNQGNEPINFTGNLFETGPLVANLMQTTDNFNSVPNTMPTTEVPVTGAPFFGPHIAPENNPIPVSGNTNNIQANTPTMFGQLEQNYM